MFSFVRKLFVCPRSEDSNQTVTSNGSPEGIKPLTTIATHQDLTVVRMKLAQKELDRLAELGLRQGTTIRVLHSTPEGALLVAIGDGRIGLNYDTAKKIYVY